MWITRSLANTVVKMSWICWLSLAIAATLTNDRICRVSIPIRKKIVLLFNPRQQNWQDHFIQRSGTIEGLSDCGRATVRLLNMNASRRVELREEWLEEESEE